MRNSERFAIREFDELSDTAPWIKDYSALKFGSDAAARRFGHELADGFFKAHSAHLLANPCVVIPSPYNYVPNAATILGRHFTNRLNHHLALSQGAGADWSLIHRKVSYTNDFGFLSKEQRRKLINNDSFYFNDDFVAGKTIIFVDDVLITETHENKMLDIMNAAQIMNNTFFLYYAKYSEGGAHPAIEAALNFARVQNIEDYLELTREPNYHVIVRPLKYLLGRTPEELLKIIQDLDSEIIYELYHGALGEGYYKIPDFQPNFGALRKRYLELF
jgi:hypothetical protein